MNPHIGDAIGAIEEKIIALTHIKDQLASLFGIPVCPPPAVERLRTKETPSARKHKPAKSTKHPRRPDASDHNRDCCLRIPSPFERGDLAKVTGLTNNGATSQIGRWMKRGWLRRVSLGVYERTAKFPGGSVAPDRREAVPTPFDKPSLSPQESLNKALKDRDAALAGGQDKLARILQDKVDRLEKELGI